MPITRADGKVLCGERKGDWIETYTGGLFYPLDPTFQEINIRDIAHSLSLLCRFNGQCSEFYSVAQHSVEVSRYIPEVLQLNHKSLDFVSQKKVMLRGLLHDAAEAYISDIPRPVKPFLEGFKAIEKKIEWMIYRKYDCADEDIGGKEDYDGFVKQSDTTLLATEARDFGMNRRGDWHLPYSPWKRAIIPMGPKEAERYFLDKFYELAGRYE